MTPWPASSGELIDSQRVLAAIVAAPGEAGSSQPRRPPSIEPWSQRSPHPAIGAAVVIFPRGQTGPRRARRPGVGCGRGPAPDRGATVVGAAASPYIPGLLALREARASRQRWRARPRARRAARRRHQPDHPRRAGFALHLGAVTGLPTIGVTHRPLLADGPWPADEPGARSPLTLEDAQVGAWVRTRAGARPVAVHAGWRTTLEVAVKVVLSCSIGHRTPEPFRHARRLARIARATSLACSRQTGIPQGGSRAPGKSSGSSPARAAVKPSARPPVNPRARSARRGSPRP